MRRPRTLLLLTLLLATLSAAAGRSAVHSAAIEALLVDLPWRNIGPAIMGGRIDDIAVVESRPTTIYLATASGGLFKTVNNGTTWEPLFDRQPTSTIGDVAVAPSRPEVVWVGTGEANNRQSSSWGHGVYRSDDGGRTWTHVGLEDTMHIGRIVIDPRNADVVYVAAVGRLWGPSPERGLYKTTDAGRTWEKVLFIDEDTGVTDVAIDPKQPEILYAAAYQRRRTPFGFNGGGPGSGLYRTMDGGRTWKRLTAGLPSGPLGRIGLDVCRSDPRVVYAIVEHASNGGVFRSEDRGETWTRVNSLNPRPMYYSQIRVDPNDPRRVWVLGVQLYYSTDGGRTFTTRRGERIHSDHHAMWIDPADSEHILLGCDGGFQITYDGGRSWDYVNGLPLAQFYEIAYDFQRPYRVYGGLQDNGSWMGPSATLYQRGPTNDEWVRIGGGDGFYVQVDPTNPRIVYAESQNGNVFRVDPVTGERKSIRPRPPDGEPPYRFDWNTPILISPHQPKKIYVGGNRLFISTDRGETWRRTEDLSTRPDRDRMPIMGVLPGPGVLSLHDGQASFGQIVTVTESPLRPGLLYVGTDDGNLQVSMDDGHTWRNVVEHVPGVPRGTYVSRVVASAHAAERVYATFDGHRSNDFRPYVFVSDDFGESWRPIAAGIPEGSCVNVIREHPRNPDLLFLGTERGAWVSFDRGRRWHRFGPPLPIVPVDDIQVHPRENDLILGTHGRGIWILDDIAPLEELAGPPLPERPHLFAPRPAIAYRYQNHKGVTGHRFFIAPNPPPGAILQFFLPTAPRADETVSLAVTGRDGRNVIRELRVPSARAGWNRVNWDLRYAPVSLATGGDGRGPVAPGLSVPGPRVLPGPYAVRLTVGGTQATRMLDVEDDPRVVVGGAERRAHFELWVRVYRQTQAAAEARRSLQRLRAQLAALQRAPQFQQAAPALRDRTAEADKRLAALQARFGAGGGPGASTAPAGGPPQPPSVMARLLRLTAALDGVTEAPSRTLRQDAAETAAALREALQDLNAFREQALPELNRALREASLTPIEAGPALEVPR